MIVHFFQDEADVTMVSFVLEAAKSGQSVICILSDDIDVFALLVFYHMNRADLQCKVHMERWDGSVLEVNATCADLGQKHFAATRHACAKSLRYKPPTLTTNERPLH